MQEAEYGMEDLEPEHFEWLDLAEEFFKYEKGENFGFGVERNVPQRNGNAYDEIEREWEQLQRMHEVLPEYVVEPKMALTREVEGEEKVVAYYAERVDGVDMYDALKSSIEHRECRSMVSGIEDKVRRLHEEDVVHGDLANNIILYPGGFKFYDPVGVPYSEEDQDNMREWDLGDVERLEDAADMFSEFR